MIVWLASYPRSGNTLLRLILFHAFGLRTCSIYNDPKDIDFDREVSEIVGHESLPPSWNPETARQDDPLWLVKTHHPPVDDSKAIYIVRDGRESSLSYLHYRNRLDAEKSTLADVIIGNVVFGSWSDHLRAWEPARRPNTLLLRFEALAANPLACLPELAAFLGITPCGDNIPGFGELHALNPHFFRSGRTHSWKETFDAPHHLLFWMLHHEEMIQYGYEEAIPEVFRQAPREAANEISAVMQAWLRAFSRQRDEQLWKREWELDEALRQTEARFAEVERQLQSRIASLENEKQSLEALCQARQATGKQLQGRLKRMEHSRSWRYTRPLRRLRGFFRQIW